MTVTRDTTAQILQPYACPPVVMPWGGIHLGASVPVTVTLRWEDADPFAVHLVVHGREVIDWEVDRELLAHGLLTPVGELDVQLAPHVNGLLVRLDNGQGGTAWFVFDTDVVTGFLAATYRQVPLGAEHMDLDAELAFLDNTGDPR